MSASVRAMLKPLVPPLLVDMLRKVRGSVLTFKGDYPSWEQASADAAGYDADEILNRVTAATRRVVRGEAVYERDSVVFDEIEYSWPLLAALLQVAAERGSLRVADFGGSLGSTWRQNRRFFDRLTLPVAWRVVEQPGFVEIGRAEFTTPALSFHATLREAGEGGVDAVLFASSLCYVSDPAQYLTQAAATGAPFLLIDRLPIIPGSTDRISVQTVTEPIYNASYPIRLFAEQTFLSRWLGQWRLIERWQCDLQPDPNAQYHGFFLEQR